MLDKPDPTPRTLETGQRELAQLERRILDKLEALEKAQEKFESRITSVPTEVDRAVGQVREFLESKIEANAKLGEAQQKASENAIGKTEGAVKESLTQMGLRSEAVERALSGKIDDLKERVTMIETSGATQLTTRSLAQSTQGHWIAVASFVLAVAVIFASVISMIEDKVSIIERPGQVVLPESAS